MKALLRLGSLARPRRARVVVTCASLLMKRELSITPVPTKAPSAKERTLLRAGRVLIPGSTVFHPTTFSLTTSSPDRLTKDEFFSSLRKAVSEAPPPHRLNEEERTITILTTPSFATWIQDVKFLGRIVDTLSERCIAPERIQTIAAVVDGLFPPRQENSEEAVTSSAEGFSFMITSEDPSSVQFDSPRALRHIHAEPSPDAGLRFYFVKEGIQDQGLTEYILPLANTLFRNGRMSTLLVTKWAKDVPNHFIAISSQYEEAATVRTVQFRLAQDPELPLDQLTKPRRIVAGLGNIVRQLEGEGKEPLPASSELEESVVTYLTSKNLPQQQVSVWALVVSEKQMRKAKSLSSDERHVWNFIRRFQAGVHRVLSGGGGWGTKAGLLSLDPETSPPALRRDDELDAFEERFANLSEQTQALGEVAKPGSYLWFFIATEGLVDENGQLAGLDRQKTHYRKFSNGIPVVLPTAQADEENAYKRMRFGCIRSTIDDIPITKSVAHPIGQDQAKMELSAEFSAQSELAVYARFRSFERDAPLQSEGPIKTESSCPIRSVTKLDVPGTTFHGWHSPYVRSSEGPHTTYDEYHK